MAHIVVLGAGLGGVIMAYEMKDQIGAGDSVTVINKGSKYSFVPSNPWVAVGWRDKEEIEVDLTEVMSRRGIALRREPFGDFKGDDLGARIGVEMVGEDERAHPARRQRQPDVGQIRRCRVPEL